MSQRGAFSKQFRLASMESEAKPRPWRQLFLEYLMEHTLRLIVRLGWCITAPPDDDS